MTIYGVKTKKGEAWYRHRNSDGIDGHKFKMNEKDKSIGYYYKKSNTFIKSLNKKSVYCKYESIALPCAMIDSLYKENNAVSILLKFVEDAMCGYHFEKKLKKGTVWKDTIENWILKGEVINNEKDSKYETQYRRKIPKALFSIAKVFSPPKETEITQTKFY